MENNNQTQARPYWLIMSLSIIVIIFWIITMCAPSIFWKFMDIILWFFLFTTGISAIINAFKNRNSELVWLLWIGGFFLTLLWFVLIFSYSQLVWTIIIWMFAIWALIRWVMLIIFWITSKEKHPLWWWIVWLWWLLFILAIIIICVPKSESRTLAWVCIWISTVFDGISLLVMALKIKNNSAVQTQLLDDLAQNEIGQWDIVITTVSIDHSGSKTQE